MQSLDFLQQYQMHGGEAGEGSGNKVCMWDFVMRHLR